MKKGLWKDEGASEPTPATDEFAAKFKTVVEANVDVVKDLVLTDMRTQGKYFRFFNIWKTLVRDRDREGITVSKQCGRSW